MSVCLLNHVYICEACKTVMLQDCNAPCTRGISKVLPPYFYLYIQTRYQKLIKSIKYSSDCVICFCTLHFLVVLLSIDTMPPAINKFFWTCQCRIFFGSSRNHFAIAIWTSSSHVKWLPVRCSWVRWLAFHFYFIVMHQNLIPHDSVQKIITLTSVAREYSLTCFHSAVFILGISWHGTHRAHIFFFL